MFTLFKQLDLPLHHFPYRAYLATFKRIRKALAPAQEPRSEHKQLRLKLYIKTLFKARTGFYWTRPDGRQFFCRTIRSLITRVMNYDGHMLKKIIRAATA